MPFPLARLASLVEELKRRGVLRVAVVYLVGAWLIIQVADVTFLRLGLPDWSVTFVIVFGALMFPVVVALAWVFDFTRRGLERTEPAGGAPLPGAEARSGDAAPLAGPRPHGAIAAAALLAIPLIAFGLWWVNDARGYSLDPALVVITPFRVAGAAPDAQYLREGLMDLIAARIGGETGLAAVAPRTVSRMIRDQLGSVDADPDREEALALARELGAGRLLEGEVVSSGDRVIVTASLFDATNGSRIGEPESIAEHPDSLYRLVDRITARLMAAGSGVTGERLAHLTTESLPALRLYLDGEHAFRRGRHGDAVRALDQAVTLDSTFALAALALLRAQGWASGAPAENDWDRATRIAARGVDRMSADDRAYFQAFTGNRAEPLGSLVTLRLRAAERAPHSAELHYLAGDGLFHWGEALGIPNARERARSLFEETVAMDSVYVEPLIHLLDYALFRDDTTDVRRWGDLLLAIDSTSPVAVSALYARQIGRAGPTRPTQPIRLDTLPRAALARVSASGPQEMRDSVLPILLEQFERASMPDEQVSLARLVATNGIRYGLPSLVDRATPFMDFGGWQDADRLLGALFWLQSDSAVRASAVDVARKLEELQALDAPEPGALEARHCLLAQAALAVDDLAGARARTAPLRDVPRRTQPEWVGEEALVCVLYVDAAIAVHQGAPDAARRVDVFDDTIAVGLPGNDFVHQTMQLAAARLWERIGDHQRALTAVRRRIYLPGASLWHVEMVGEEARLADRLGRRDEAIRAYRTYIGHRPDPEAPFRERTDAARARLAALLGES